MPASKAQQAAVAERRKKAIALKLAGLDPQAIADQLGYPDRHTVCQDIRRALEANIVEQKASREQLREMELMRLDQLTVEVFRVLKARHYVVTQSGRIVDDPRTGAPMTDDGPVLHAVDRLLKIQDRRAKLLGIDSPQRVEVLSLDAIDAAIADRNAQLAAADAEADALAGTEGAEG